MLFMGCAGSVQQCRVGLSHIIGTWAGRAAAWRFATPQQSCLLEVSVALLGEPWAALAGILLGETCHRLDARTAHCTAGSQVHDVMTWPVIVWRLGLPCGIAVVKLSFGFKSK